MQVGTLVSTTLRRIINITSPRRLAGHSFLRSVPQAGLALDPCQLYSITPTMPAPHPNTISRLHIHLHMERFLHTVVVFRVLEQEVEIHLLLQVRVFLALQQGTVL